MSDKLLQIIHVPNIEYAHGYILNFLIIIVDYLTKAYLECLIS